MTIGFIVIKSFQFSLVTTFSRFWVSQGKEGLCAKQKSSRISLINSSWPASWKINTSLRSEFSFSLLRPLGVYLSHIHLCQTSFQKKDVNISYRAFWDPGLRAPCRGKSTTQKAWPDRVLKMHWSLTVMGLMNLLMLISLHIRASLFNACFKFRFVHVQPCILKKNTLFFIQCSVMTHSTFAYTLFFIRNSFIRNLYWDGQIAKKLSALKPQKLRNF